MGVERGVIRWYAQRQLLLEELASLDAKEASTSDAQNTLSPEDFARVEELGKRRAETQRQLRLLGPCPTPMMG